MLDKYPMPHLKVSAKTAFNVSTIFEDLGKLIIQDIKMEMIEKDWFEERYPSIQQIEENIR
jgi:hypothetical protein